MVTRRGFIRNVSFGAMALGIGGSGLAQEGAKNSTKITRTALNVDFAKTGLSATGVDGIVKQFESMLESGLWRGGQLAVYRNGEIVLEVVGGTDGTGKPVRPDSILGILSTSKTLGAMVMYYLHDQGVFSFEDPIAKHWPAFAKNGKEKITIRQLMSHRAGLVGSGPFDGLQQWPEWKKPGKTKMILEDLKPKWVPGSRNAYHALTYGQVIEELVILWTGKTTGENLRQHFTGPMNIRNVYLGIPREVYDARFAPFHPPERLTTAQTEQSSALSPPGGEKHFFNSFEILGLSLPWGGGTATARDLANLFNVYAYEGTFGNRTFFSKGTFSLGITPQNSPEVIDGGVGARAVWGLGLLVDGTEGTIRTKGNLYGSNPGPRTCGHLGGNTALAWADPDLRLTMAFLSTGTTGRVSYTPLADAIRAACLSA